jgi:hypothetical protein
MSPPSSRGRWTPKGQCRDPLLRTSVEPGQTGPLPVTLRGDPLIRVHVRSAVVGDVGSLTGVKAILSTRRSPDREQQSNSRGPGIEQREVYRRLPPLP